MPASAAASSKPSFSEPVIRIWRTSVFEFMKCSVLHNATQSQRFPLNVLHVAVLPASWGRWSLPDKLLGPAWCRGPSHPKDRVPIP